jgi:hypothetical protein
VLVLPFHERLHPSAGAWSLAALAGAMVGGVLLPFTVLGAVALAVVTAALVALALDRAAAVVDVTGTWLRAGRAGIDVAFLGEATALDREAARAALGPGLDARAYVLTRPWVRTAVQVELQDPRDPTPYWYVATRRPAALVAAIEEARSGHDSQAAHSVQTS